MSKIRTLIVDDSFVFRSQIRHACETIDAVELVGTASNGRDALKKISETHVDLMTLDLEMPEMNGIETLKEMRRLQLPTKVIVFSSFSKSGAEITLEALSLGASDFVLKPHALTEEGAGIPEQPSDRIKKILMPTILSLFPQNPDTNLDKNQTSHPIIDERILPALRPYAILNKQSFQPTLVVIGCSTGGPRALDQIFSHLKGPIHCPLFIVQHMPPTFTASLAERLGKLSGIESAEAQHGETLKSNRIYVAPGAYHSRLVESGGKIEIRLDQGPLINSIRPAVDPLFSSAAQIFKNKCLGIVLTGMGQDGKDGAIAIKSFGGAVAIQNKESCVVFGMPGAVHQSGAYDWIENLEQISQLLRSKICV